MFVGADNKTVYSISYNLQENMLKPINRTVLVEHLTRKHPVKAIALQDYPDNVVWVVTDDGKLCSFTVEKNEDVYSWSHSRIKDSNFLDVISIGTCTDSTTDRTYGDLVFVVEGRDGTQYLCRQNEGYSDIIGEDGVTVVGANCEMCDVREITKNDAQPGNRCFLVVMNKSAEKGFRMPRIIPGILDVKWYDDKANGQTTVPAQGYLYLGGETVAKAEDFTGFAGTAFTPEFDGLDYERTRLFSDFQRLPSGDNTKVTSEETRTAEYGLDDYFFTSCYLFGQYNQPSWYRNALEEFADCWLNGAGFGKAGYLPGRVKACCGRPRPQGVGLRGQAARGQPQGGPLPLHGERR